MNSFQKTAAVFVGAALYLTYLTWGAISNRMIPAGDLAADMLLTNRIWDEGYLLVGHYSRWGFNHPGPFWFYCNAMAEFVFGRFFPSRWQAWQLGSIFINSTLITFSAVSLSKYLFDKINLKYSLLFLLLFIGFIGSETTNVWMPDRLIVPYAAFLVCVLMIIFGDYNYLLPATLIGCILIHGYATMPIFTLPLIAGGALIGYFKNRNSGLFGIHKKIILFSCAIALFFALPIFVDSIISEPSNIRKLFSANASFKAMPKPSWRDMSAFISDLIFKEKSIGWKVSVLALVPITIFARSLRADNRLKIYYSFSLFLFVVLLTIIYYKNMPAPIYPFVAQYLVGITPLFFSIAISPAFQPCTSKNLAHNSPVTMEKALKLGLIVLIIFSLSFPLKISARPDPGLVIADFADKIQEIRPGNTVAIDNTDHAQWPFIAGLLLELDRRGIEACSTWSHMAFLYSDKHICSSSNFPDMQIVKSDTCDDSCLLNKGGFGLKIAPWEKK